MRQALSRPGAAPGLFALESAIDEMAQAAGIDPLEFRMNNHAERDESQDLAFSSNHIREATEQAAEKFGWHDQPPEVEVILLDYPDLAFNEFGARGIGEIGITGMAAAVANAVHHATGKRIRDLPIFKEKLMENVPDVQSA